MIEFWLNDGKPLPDGRICLVQDLQDGSLPIKVYGKDEAEVNRKIRQTNMHAQVALGRRAAPAGNQPGPRAVPGNAPAAERRLTLTADEQMQATADLGNPAKAPAAAKKLIESATGLDLDALTLAQFGERAKAWQATHPELADSRFNVKLIFDNAKMRAGKVANIDATVLEAVYQELKAGGYLVAEDDAPANENSHALPVQPGETPAPRTAQTGSTFATSHRGSRLGAPQTPTWKPKYTREQIDRMPSKDEARLLKDGDKDYADAVNYWYPPKTRATA